MKSCFAVWFVTYAEATLAAEQGIPQGAALRSGRPDSKFFHTTATDSRVGTFLFDAHPLLLHVLAKYVVRSESRTT